MAQVPALPKLSDVKSVFQSSTTLGSFFRGTTGNVPPIANAYGAVSTTQPRLLSFANLIYPPVSLPAGVGGFDFSIVPAAASVYVYVNNNGYIRETIGGVQQSNVAWKHTGHQADYDVQFIRTANDGGAGDSVNTWLNLVTSRSWSVTTSGGGFSTKSQSGYLLLRMNASPQTVFANVAIQLQAETEV